MPIKSWHPACNAAAFRDDIIAGFANTELARPDYFEHTGQKQKIQGMLDFISVFRTKGKPGRYLERSRFIKTVSGIILTIAARSWVEMNPYPCGSNHFKKCCDQ